MNNIQREGPSIQINNGHTSIRVSCPIPQYGKDDIDDINMIVEYFYSPYYSAAKDFFGIKLGKENFWGMIYPATLLDESNSELYKDMKGFQHHMLTLGLNDISYKFLSIMGNYDNNFEDTDFISILDMPLLENLFILVVDKSIYADVDNALPSLFTNGYLYVNSPFDISGVKIDFHHSDYLETILSREKEKKIIKINTVSDTIQNFQFYPILYKEILPLNIPSAFRYILLYQTIEFLMDKKKNEVLIENLEKADIRNRGDLRDSLQKAFKEESLIKKIYEGIKVENGIYFDFNEKAKSLFDKVGKEYTLNDTFCDFMYGVRNVIVHNYREASRYINLIKDLTEIFEIAIEELMIKVEMTDCDNKKIFIINKDESYKDNKHRFYNAYH